MPTDIYNLLTGVKIDDATITQLDAATGRTYVDKDTREFWQGILTLSHVIRAARTYPLGGVIPETGTVLIETIANGADSTMKPTGTEVWRVENVDADNCTLELGDADGNLSPILLTAPAGAPYTPTWSVPFHLTPTMWLKFTNGSGSEQTPSIAYHKVSL